MIPHTRFRYDPPQIVSTRRKAGRWEVRVYLPPHPADRIWGTTSHIGATPESALAAAMTPMFSVLRDRLKWVDQHRPLYRHTKPQTKD